MRWVYNKILAKFPPIPYTTIMSGEHKDKISWVKFFFDPETGKIKEGFDPIYAKSPEHRPNFRLVKNCGSCKYFWSRKWGRNGFCLLPYSFPIIKRALDGRKATQKMRALAKLLTKTNICGYCDNYQFNINLPSFFRPPGCDLPWDFK